MELRTRFLPKLLNSEVDEYLKSNDIIIVPVGTVEMHGGKWRAACNTNRSKPRRPERR